MAYIDIEVDLNMFDTDDLISELSYRTLSRRDYQELLDIVKDYKDEHDEPNTQSLFSPTLLGEQVYNALAELVKNKTELELLELFDKAK